MNQGRFYLMGGGAAIRSPGQPFLRDFVDKAGGPDKQICIITAGSDEGPEINAIYWDLFQEVGVTRMVSPNINEREDADDEGLAKLVEESDGVFIAGGSQQNLIHRLSETAIENAIVQVFNRGGLLGGTSSGASLFGHPMILEGGTVDRHLRHDMIEYCRGFDLMGANVSVDTHCSSRGRIPRLLSLLLRHPELQVIGMDEDTCLYIDENKIGTVVGYHSIYVLDGSIARINHERLSASDVRIQCLRHGDRYDIANRTMAS